MSEEAEINEPVLSPTPEGQTPEESTPEEFTPDATESGSEIETAETAEPVEPVEPADESEIPTQTPWWVAESLTPADAAPVRKTATITWYMALAMALIAGVVGAFLGRSSFMGTNELVSVQQTVERAPNSIAGIAARVSPSVVEIDSESSAGSDTGTGFFINNTGYIMTNNHVVEGAVLASGKITVKLSNNEVYSATVVGRDTSYDLAVLKITLTNTPALQLGDSSKVEVGDAVIAIGSPLGLQGTVTSGIISAKNRPVTTSSDSKSGENSYIDALQTDAAINPGNSGGPLVDASGAVIGVNSAIASLGQDVSGQPGSIGLGFAIPINQAKKTAQELIKSGHATYPIVGLSLDSRFAGPGARIADVPNAILKGGPAEKVGLRAGDVILAIDGQPIAMPDDMIVAIRSHSVGDVVTLKYQRGTVTKTVKVTLVASK